MLKISMAQNMVVLQIVYPQTREPFGEHLKKTAWKAYSDFLSSQHADTPQPDDFFTFDIDL